MVCLLYKAIGSNKGCSILLAGNNSLQCFDSHMWNVEQEDDKWARGKLIHISFSFTAHFINEI